MTKKKLSVLQGNAVQCHVCHGIYDGKDECPEHGIADLEPRSMTQPHEAPLDRPDGVQMGRTGKWHYPAE
jgi:hypothetical protein